ncbi:hypothetical protein OHC33_008172 [Knufia fluminis]|uniref:Uncharacterized protein n=1 Tax=Knufia fluminis TaxID=191047 RepID=A0AAN8EAQ5_9EURO|nr:hypothetical protein OHC33_008172 [Knufia fluminis]
MPALLVSAQTQDEKLAEAMSKAIKYCAAGTADADCHYAAIQEGICVPLLDPEHTGVKGATFSNEVLGSHCNMYANKDCKEEDGLGPNVEGGMGAYTVDFDKPFSAYKCVTSRTEPAGDDGSEGAPWATLKATA